MTNVRKPDSCKAGFAWVDNQVIDELYAKLGVSAVAVYTVLCRYANNKTGKCFPSQALIARRLDISIPTVRRAIRILVEHGLITTEMEGTGRFAKTIYTVLPCSIQSQTSPQPSTAEEATCEGVKAESYQKSPPEADSIPSQIATNNTNLETNKTNIVGSPSATDESTLTPSSSQGKTDPRYGPFKDLLAAYWKKCTGMKLPWDRRDGEQLNRFLKTYPELDYEGLHRWLVNCYLSPDVNLAKRPFQFLPYLHNYMLHPVDRYNHEPAPQRKQG
jgi:DNA-binding transcriptional ArsR family regulator